MPAKPTAFLSYHRTSARQIAQTIHDGLNARGADVFYDFDVPRGQNWQLILPQELSRRDYHLVVLTPATASSSGVLNEISLSLQQGKTIIPIMAAGFSFGLPNLPPEIAALSSYMGVYFDSNDPNAAIEELADAIGLPKAPVPAAQTVNNEKAESNKQGMSNEVKVAIIVGIFGLITTILTGFFGLAPSLIPLFLRPNPTTTATLTLSPTVAITNTHPPTPIPPTDTPPTRAPTDAVTVVPTDTETPSWTPTTPAPTDTATVWPTETETPTLTETPTSVTATIVPTCTPTPIQQAVPPSVLTIQAWATETQIAQAARVTYTPVPPSILAVRATLTQVAIDLFGCSVEG